MTIRLAFLGPPGTFSEEAAIPLSVRPEALEGRAAS
jgi:hypothetical protein